MMIDTKNNEELVITRTLIMLVQFDNGTEVREEVDITGTRTEIHNTWQEDYQEPFFKKHIFKSKDYNIENVSVWFTDAPGDNA